MATTTDRPLQVDHIVRFGTRDHPHTYREMPPFFADLNEIARDRNVYQIIRTDLRTTIVHRIRSTLRTDGRWVTVVIDENGSTVCASGLELRAPASCLALPDDPQLAGLAAIDAWIGIDAQAHKWFWDTPHAPEVVPLVDGLRRVQTPATVALAAAGHLGATHIRFTPPSPLGAFRCHGVDADGRVLPLHDDVQAHLGRGVPSALFLDRRNDENFGFSHIWLEAISVDYPIVDVSAVDAVRMLRDDPMLKAAA